MEAGQGRFPHPTWSLLAVGAVEIRILMNPLTGNGR